MQHISLRRKNSKNNNEHFHITLNTNDPGLLIGYCYKSGHSKNPLFNLIYNNLYSTKSLYIAYSVYLHFASISRTTYLCSVIPSPVHFFYLPHNVPIEVEVLLSLWQISCSIRPFFSNLSFSFCFSLEFAIFSYCSTRFSTPYFSVHRNFKSVLCNDFGKSGKDYSRKMNSDIVLHE